MVDNGLIITETNIRTISLDDLTNFSNDFWHKFIVVNGASAEKEEVLKAVLDSIHPIDLVPVKYSTCGQDAYFLARNCNQVIAKFYDNSLAPICLKNNTQVSLKIQMCYISVNDFKINMQYLLKEAIEKRFKKSKDGSIDLSSFHKEPDLYDILYCPLSKPRFLVYVLNIVKKILTVTHIDLSSNDITDLKPLEILQTFKGLSGLNLSKNKIYNGSYIEVLGKAVPALTSININDNPICSKFPTELVYIQWIKKCLPSIRMVDGVCLNYGVPNQKFWLCDNSLWPLVNDFVKQYFTLYDINRKLLESMYAVNSVFSMSCYYSPDYLHNSTLRLYKQKSTALLKLHDQYKIIPWCYLINSKIIGFLSELPESQHEHSSFKIDLLRCEGKHILLVVSGLFKDFQHPSEIRSFSRTFLLQKIGDVEYKITNEMYHVTNATKEQIKASSLEKATMNERKKLYDHFQEEKKWEMAKTVSELTNMNLAYSRKCLSEVSWNMRKALEIFLNNYRNGIIPLESFTAKTE